ncbi:MAG: hypothetical protein JWR75_1882 [Devosia sp.]|nr:hypothetical protein [Devosia sp.]
MTKHLMYLGGVSSPVGYAKTATAPGVSAYEFDDATGQAVLLGSVPSINPTFVARAGDCAYAVNELSGATEGTVSAFDMAKLSALAVQPSGGMTPAHVSVDRSGKWVFAAHYAGAAPREALDASVSVFPILADGSVGPRVSEVRHSGSGPNRDRQERPHAHCARATPDNRFVLVADLGIDRVMIHAFDAATGQLTPHGEGVLPAGFGPRHFDFHATQPLVVVSGELANEAAVLGLDTANGTLTLLGTASTLPPDFTGNSACSEIHWGPDERFFYVANRFHDSISMFSVLSDGTPKLLEVVASGGATPRHFAFDPSGQWLLVANQDSDRLSVFSVSSAPLKHRHDIAVGTPTCIAF